MSRVESAAYTADGQKSLVTRIEAELSAYAELGLDTARSEDLVSKWRDLVDTQPKLFINEDQSLNLEALQNFRRSQIFVADYPTREFNVRSLRNFIGGERRGHKKRLNECLEVLQQHGYADLLRKYPCSPVGNPFIYNYQGFSYTFRWTRHVYLLGLLNRVLADKLGDEFVALDIGSSYGIFSDLVKQEHPRSHHVLVDFPEQLILAYYFLGIIFPEARIAGVKELQGQQELTRDFFNQYDFCLLPWPMYEQIAAGSIDLVTNFVSLGEMSRKFFDYYLNAPAFQTAGYFFTANRIVSLPDYETDLTIRDYPIWEPGKMLHFGVSPIYSNIYRYPRKRMFFNERVAYPPSFEYIGQI